MKTIGVIVVDICMSPTNLLLRPQVGYRRSQATVPHPDQW